MTGIGDWKQEGDWKGGMGGVGGEAEEGGGGGLWIIQ